MVSLNGPELTMSTNHEQPDAGRADDARRKRRTAWIALSIALVFFAGVILKRILLG